MSVSFIMAIQAMVRINPQIKLIVIDQLKATTKMKGNWDPSKGAVGKAVKAGFCNIMNPVTDAKGIIFVQYYVNEMRASDQVSTIQFRLDGSSYRITVVVPTSSRANERVGGDDSGWSLESMKLLHPDVAKKLLTKAEEQIKRNAAEDAYWNSKNPLLGGNPITGSANGNSAVNSAPSSGVEIINGELYNV